MSQLFLWTNPGKPVWDLIKYDSHKNADIASFLLGDNKEGRGAQEHTVAKDQVWLLYFKVTANFLFNVDNDYFKRN